MLRLAIVEDTQTKAALLRAMFVRDGRYFVVAVAKTANLAAALAAHRPDVVIVDRMLPDGDGLATADDLSHRMPEARIYVYSATDPAAVLPSTVGYLRDEDMRQWPEILATQQASDDVFVRHPKRNRAGSARS